MDLLEAADKALERLKEMSDDELLEALENCDESIAHSKWNFVDNYCKGVWEWNVG